LLSFISTQKKNIIRSILIIIIGVFGGNICDKQFNNNFPILTIIFSIASVMMAVSIRKMLSDNHE